MANKKPIVQYGGTKSELPSSDSLDVGSLAFSTVGSVLKADAYCGNTMLQWLRGSGVADGYLQSFFGRKRINMMAPLGGSVNYNTYGTFSPSTSGTQTARNPATTNYFTRTNRVGFVGAATANSSTGVRLAKNSISLGNGTIGGFLKVLRFGCSDAVTVATARQIVGVGADLGGFTGAEPSTYTQFIGVGNNSTDTNLKIFYGGTAAQTPIDLGANFPANTLSVDVYELALFSPPEVNGTVFWRVERLNTGDVASGQITDTTGVKLPSPTTLISPLHFARNNGTTALAVGIDLMLDYTETNY